LFERKLELGKAKKPADFSAGFRLEAFRQNWAAHSECAIKAHMECASETDEI
jgi:hypothetical protein